METKNILEAKKNLETIIWKQRAGSQPGGGSDEVSARDLGWDLMRSQPGSGLGSDEVLAEGGGVSCQKVL